MTYLGRTGGVEEEQEEVQGLTNLFTRYSVSIELRRIESLHRR